MDKDTASKMMAAVLSLEVHVGEIDSIISDMPDGDEKSAFTKGLGNILKAVNFDFVFRIIKQFPELDPDKDLRKR